VTNLLLLAAEEAVPNQVVDATQGAIGVSYLIPLLPLLGFALVLLLTRTLKERTAFVAIGASAASFLLSVAVALQVIGEPATYVRPMFDWIPAAGLQVSFDLLVDQLTAVMLLVVTGVGTLVHVYSYGSSPT
jgi:NADH-quinone oxidoreductase subunit L